MRDAHAVGQLARAQDRARRAAAALGVGGRVGPELERHRHHVVTGVDRQLRRGGAVHAAAHRHQRPARTRAPGAARRRARRRPARGAERPRRARRRGGWRAAARRARPPRRSAVSRAAARNGVPSTSSTTALPAARAGGAAARVEAGLHHALALHADRDAHQVAAGGAAGRARVPPVRQRPAAARGVEMILEAHAASLTHGGRRAGGGEKVAPACRCLIRELGLLS